MAVNLLPLLPELSGIERKLARDAMRRDDPEGPDYSNLTVLALQPCERVIAALGGLYLAYGTTTAPALACKLYLLQRS